MESKKKFSIIMQLLIIGVFTCFMLASATTNKAVTERITSANEAINLLSRSGYKQVCFDRNYSNGFDYFVHKKGDCKATVCRSFRGDDKSRLVMVIFQNCEASSYLKDEIKKIANCTYLYDNSDYDYCSSSKGGTSPNTETSSPSSSSSKDCSLNYWVERRGSSYVPYFQKSGNCGLSLDYSIYSVASDKLLYSGHLYFTKSGASPSTGYSYNESIRIVITSKKWD